MSGNVNLYAAALIVAAQGIVQAARAFEAFQGRRALAGAFWVVGSGCALVVAFNVWSAA